MELVGELDPFISYGGSLATMIALPWWFWQGMNKKGQGKKKRPKWKNHILKWKTMFSTYVMVMKFHVYYEEYCFKHLECMINIFNDKWWRTKSTKIMGQK
jgi:hypothetical protein